MGRDRKCMRIKFEGSQSYDRNFGAENGQKVVNFEVVYLGK